MAKNDSFRHFAKMWDSEKAINMQTKNQIYNFCYLCREMYANLKSIKKYDEKLFNSISDTTIDDYMQVFDNLYRNFYNDIFKISYEEQEQSIDKENNYYEVQFDFWKTDKRFEFYSAEVNDEKFLYKYIDNDNCINDDAFKAIIGIKDEYYDSIKSKVNQILILERELKFITMKPEFWKGLENDSKKINLENDYIICGKILFDDGWRKDRNEKEILDFADNKIYQSASIINQYQTNRLFNPPINNSYISKKAFLIYEFDLDKVVCLSFSDAYSDELINGDTKFKEITMHTDIQKIDEETCEGNKHELFAYGPVFGTLNTMLNSHSSYNEVVLKNPKPIAVMALNNYSEDYARELSEKYNIEYVGVAKYKSAFNYKELENKL